jgi:hypothetical protein
VLRNSFIELARDLFRNLHRDVDFVVAPLAADDVSLSVKRLYERMVAIDAVFVDPAIALPDAIHTFHS